MIVYEHMVIFELSWLYQRCVYIYIYIYIYQVVTRSMMATIGQIEPFDPDTDVWLL